MIDQTLKRETKVYWKRGEIYECAYFLSLNPMPVAPHAVTIRHNGNEAIVKDFEVFTELDKFKDKYSIELGLLKVSSPGRGLIKHCAKELEMSYSRLLRIIKKARAMGIELPASRKTNEKAKKAIEV